MSEPQVVECFPRDARVAAHQVVLEGGVVGVLDSAALRRRVDTWPVAPATPPSTATMLATARALLVQGSVTYEFFTVAVMWALLAVEGALNTIYPTPTGERTPSLGVLLKRATADGRLDAVWLERLDAARQLRDGLAHPTHEETIFSPVYAVPVVDVTHQAVARLFAEPHH